MSSANNVLVRGSMADVRPASWPHRALTAVAWRCGILVMLAAAASLIGCFGAYFWLADLAAHFSVFYFLLSLLAAPVLLAAGRRWMALLAGAVLLFNAVMLLPVRPAPAGACDTPLTVLQANVHGGETSAEQFAVW